jgi:hypothetical protein
LTDVFVPDENFFELPFGASFAPDPIFGKFPEVLVLSHGTVAVGSAGSALLAAMCRMSSIVKMET